MAITAASLQLRTPKCAPLTRLAKPHFYHPNPTASDSAPENKQSPDSISTILESKKQDSSKSPSQADSLSSRDFRKEVVAIHSTSLDSSANAVDSMDCHALRSKARNDRKPQNLNDSAQDSRIFDKNAPNMFCSQVDRRQDFCDKNGALQGESRARTWACVTADSPQQSPFLAKKPTRP